MSGFFSWLFDKYADIPDLTGRVAVVTGANAGIGFHTAQQLASHGAKLYVCARSEEKARQAIDAMVLQDPSLKDSGRLAFLLLDLSSVVASKKAAEKLLNQESRLDILINNAGEYFKAYGLTEEGISKVMASNHLGHFVFTTALLPLLESTAKLRDADVRIVNVSSESYAEAPPGVKFASIEDFKDPGSPDPLRVDTFRVKLTRYGVSKLANVLFTNELQRRWDAANIPALAIAIHPGRVATVTGENTFPSVAPILKLLNMTPLIRLISLTPIQGAYTSLFAATSTEIRAHWEDVYKGAFLVPYGRATPVTELGSNSELAKQLWATSERISAEILRSSSA